MFFGRVLCLVTSALVASILLVAPLNDAVAKTSKKRAAGHMGYVTAYSFHGNGSLTAPVRIDRRRGFVIKQVRLPGGVWINCGFSCAETLRIEKVDFWEQFGDSDQRKR